MKIGIALSGGGVKGAAHIGVLKALQENNIKIDIIGGTSSGSIVATLYAIGYTINEILEIFNAFAKSIMGGSPKYLLSALRSKNGILGTRSGENIEIAVKEVAKNKNIRNINEIKMPLVIPTVDLMQGKKYVFTNMKLNEDYYINNIPIGKAVRASSSFPVVFAPCEFEEHQFLDGGILDNIPTYEVKKIGADKVISVMFPTREEKKNNMYSILLKSIDIMSNKIAEQGLQYSNTIINIDIENTKIFKVDKIQECYNIGYETTIQNINKIKQAIIAER